MSFFSKKYEWSAFTEADLLANGKNGTDFGRGDSFVVGQPTTKMSTYDDDSTLSGASTSWLFGKGATDSWGQDAYVNGCRVGCQMYAEQYHVLTGSNGKTYYMIEILVEDHDSAGAGNGYFTFYGAQPPQGITLTVTSTCNVSGSWIDYSCLGAGTTAPPNTPPYFTNVPANGIFCVNENTKLVIDLEAADKEGDALSFSIVGGADGAQFTIDANTGVLSFINAPDYEKPTDAGANNVYNVIVSVSDGKGGVSNKELCVQVKDVAEGTPGDCIIIEAESMNLCNYSVCSSASASGQKYVTLGDSFMGSVFGRSGYTQTKFQGETGEYDFKIRYYDEKGGDGNINVLVNGKCVMTIRLNTEKNGWMEKTLEGLDLKKGDIIKLEGSGKGCESAMIDKIELCPTTQPGSLEGRIFFDANRDGIDNNEAGISGLNVQLLNAAGAVVATAITAADGSYKFDNLQPGDYIVAFPTSTADGKVLTQANVGGNDAIDSDANTSTGLTGTYNVPSGGHVIDVDAGMIIKNDAPDAHDDAAKTCADTAKAVNVLANDTDPNGDSLTVTQVNGQNITEGQSVNLNGVLVTLAAGQLVFDASNSAYADQLIGTSTKVTYTYTVSDGNGGTDTANVDMTYCGTVNTLETIRDSLPETGVMKLSLDLSGGTFYTALITNTGDERFDGKSFDVVFCGNADLSVTMGVNIPVNIYLGTEAEAPASIDHPENLDMVNWILNQAFTGQDNGDGNGKTYTEAEIQGAIWGLTNGEIIVNEANPTFGTVANAQEIYDLAMANGEGYEAGEGDIVSIILDPTNPTAANAQPMIIGINFDDLAQDCFCF